MIGIYNEILYRPLFNIMVYLQGVIPGGDLGLTIVVLTVLIRVLFSPLSLKTIKSQQSMKELSPKIEEVKAKFKDDKAAQSAAIMKLYKDNNVNPLAGCLPLLIQLPILIALYQVFIRGITPESLTLLYGFISAPEVIHHNFLGIFDVTARSRLLTLFAGGFQFIQSKQSMALQADGGDSPAGGKEMAALSKQMLYFFPIMIIIIGWNLPAGLILYWIATTVFSVFEQTYIRGKSTKPRHAQNTDRMSNS
ncbi:MAG: membrane protein insertase YidC [Candidatus Yanofskybacteria bacterium]|nr:membrane protein insertase YidC [Candidatus Yanofskybacteria bacterium]